MHTRTGKLQTALLVTGIIITVIGLALYFGIPSITYPEFALTTDAGGTSVEHILFYRVPVEYLFRLEISIWSAQGENSSIYLLNATEYQRYLSGTPLDDLEAILHVSDASSALWESVIVSNLDVYLILVNDNTFEVVWEYFYAVIPPTFFPSLLTLFVGMFLVIFALAWQLPGYRRYFLAGLAINLTLFFLRVTTLVHKLLGVPMPVHMFLELYNDYYLLYVPWVRRLWQGILPYSSNFPWYIYPPLFIYTISALGSSTAWFPGVTLFAFNVATGILVYRISKHLTGDERRSIFAMMLYLLNPLTLVYGSFLWLNPTPYVFFVTLSFFLALAKQRNLSVITLAMASLFKQFTVVFFPLLVILLIRTEKEGGWRKAVTTFAKSTVIYAVVLLIVSVPFLIVDAGSYINRTILSSMTRSVESLATFYPDPGYPVTFNTFFLWIGAPPILTVSIAYLLVYYVLLGVPGIFVFVALARGKVDDEPQETRFKKLVVHALFWSIIIVLLVQLFFPRGAYKFYLLALMPFIAILFDYKDLTLSLKEPFSFKIRHLFPVLMSLVIFLCHRYVYFWVLIIWILFYIWKWGALSRTWNTIKTALSRPSKSM